MNGQAAARDVMYRTFVPLPLALWMLSLGSDAVYLFGFGGPVWKDIALYAMAGGVGAALASAFQGCRDDRSGADSGTPSHVAQVRSLQGGLLLLYSVNVWIRLTAPPDAALPVWVSLSGLVLLCLASRQGGDRGASGAIDPSPHAVKKSPRVI